MPLNIPEPTHYRDVLDQSHISIFQSCHCITTRRRSRTWSCKRTNSSTVTTTSATRCTTAKVATSSSRAASALQSALCRRAPAPAACLETSRNSAAVADFIARAGKPIVNRSTLPNAQTIRKIQVRSSSVARLRTIVHLLRSPKSVSI